MSLRFFSYGTRSRQARRQGVTVEGAEQRAVAPGRHEARGGAPVSHDVSPGVKHGATLPRVFHGRRGCVGVRCDSVLHDRVADPAALRGERGPA